MMTFHSPEYIDFVRRVTPENQHDFSKQLQASHTRSQSRLARLAVMRTRRVAMLCTAG